MSEEEKIIPLDDLAYIGEIETALECYASDCINKPKYFIRDPETWDRLACKEHMEKWK